VVGGKHCGSGFDDNVVVVPLKLNQNYKEDPGQDNNFVSFVSQI
jgi:hypothetical protein